MPIEVRHSACSPVEHDLPVVARLHELRARPPAVRVADREADDTRSVMRLRGFKTSHGGDDRLGPDGLRAPSKSPRGGATVVHEMGDARRAALPGAALPRPVAAGAVRERADRAGMVDRADRDD